MPKYKLEEDGWWLVTSAGFKAGPMTLEWIFYSEWRDVVFEQEGAIYWNSYAVPSFDPTNQLC